MPRKTGTVTGASLNQSNRGKKGSLTGSKRFDTPETLEPTIEQTPEQIADDNARKRLQERFSTTDVSQTQRTANTLTTAQSSEILNQAKQLASDHGIEMIDLAGELSADPYKASSAIPLMEAKDANRERMIIQKQNNALEVRLDRIKQKRKIATISKEELSLVGDLADIRTTGFDVGKKFVKSEIANTDLLTEQSRLQEHEVLLDQQIIRTNGVAALTEGIQTEWNLKLEKQTRANERLEIEIQGAVDANQRRRDELEAFMFSE